MSTALQDWIPKLEKIRESVNTACQHSGRDPRDVQLLAITKSLSREAFTQIPGLGISEIGENRILEGLSRRQETGFPFRWHMVGHVQTNKVKKLLDWADVLHSLDRLSLLEVLEKELVQRNRILPCYLQVNVSGESSKGGFSPEETGNVISKIREEAGHIDLAGLMTMAPAEKNPRPFFRRLRELGQEFGLSGLSMGMSQDFEIAIEEGATCIRIGGGIFR